MRLAENLTYTKKVAVITQDYSNLKKNLKDFKRGSGVKFFTVSAISNSSSNFFIRIFDAFFFMICVLIYLIRTRPKKIYVSTDPPVLVPLIVAIYSKIFKVKYFYHLQDVHPEATNVVFKINKFFFNILKNFDNFSVRNANVLITLNEVMKYEIINRSRIKRHISIIENPSVQFKNNFSLIKKKDFHSQEI